MTHPEPAQKLRILIVARAFYPGTWPRAFRTTELAKEFARQGHNVTVCIPEVTDERIQFAHKHGFKLKCLGKLNCKGLDVNGNKFVALGKKIINRLLNWLGEYPNIQLTKMVSKALQNEKGYDLLISIAKPFTIHWGVAKARRKNQELTKLWVADCGDPYLRSADSDINPPFYFHWVDSWFLRTVDYVAVPIKEALCAYNQRYIHKFRIIPQGFRFEDIVLYKGPLEKEKKVFGYAGMFIPGKRDPSKLLGFLNSLGDEYKFEFNVYTHSPWLIEPFAVKSGGRIRLHPVMPRENVLYEMSKMHFVVNFENTGITQSPSKLIDYGILGKPILNIKKDLNSETILQFLEGDYSGAYIVENVSQYRIENVCGSFVNLLANEASKK